MDDIKYRTFDEFKKIFTRIQNLERTILSASDYVKFMQRRYMPENNERWVEDIDILLQTPQSPAVIDLFGLDGQLRDVQNLIACVGTGYWNLDSVWDAYNGLEGSPGFSGGPYSISQHQTTSIVRESFHTLDGMIKKGCNLLFCISRSDLPINFFNRGIPGRIIYRDSPSAGPYR